MIRFADAKIVSCRRRRASNTGCISCAGAGADPNAQS
jgi:hypothetical protein